MSQNLRNLYIALLKYEAEAWTIKSIYSSPITHIKVLKNEEVKHYFLGRE